MCALILIRFEGKIEFFVVFCFGFERIQNSILIIKNKTHLQNLFGNAFLQCLNFNWTKPVHTLIMYSVSPKFIYTKSANSS